MNTLPGAAGASAASIPEVIRSANTVAAAAFMRPSSALCQWAQAKNLDSSNRKE
jgi:hypothetical protein